MGLSIFMIPEVFFFFKDSFVKARFNVRDVSFAVAKMIEVCSTSPQNLVTVSL